jgi:putative transposase
VLSEHGCKIAPNTYFVAKKRPPSARAVRDEQLKLEIARVHAANLDVYGADKIWTQLNREGIRVARCTIERLMREMGLSGVRRGRAYKVTTHADERQHRPSDLVERNFTAPAPNRLWVADLTYVKTHSGWVYAAFIVDVFSRMVVGWQLSNSLRSSLAIDALEMAIWNRTRDGGELTASFNTPTGARKPNSTGGRNTSMMEVTHACSGAAASSAVVSRADSLTWTTSSSRRSATSTGSTIAGCTARSPTTPAT